MIIWTYQKPRLETLISVKTSRNKFIPILKTVTSLKNISNFLWFTKQRQHHSDWDSSTNV